MLLKNPTFWTSNHLSALMKEIVRKVANFLGKKNFFLSRYKQQQYVRRLNWNIKLYLKLKEGRDMRVKKIYIICIKCIQRSSIFLFVEFTNNFYIQRNFWIHKFIENLISIQIILSSLYITDIAVKFGRLLNYMHTREYTISYALFALTISKVNCDQQPAV